MVSELLDVSLISLGLAMDCFAVAITRGIETRRDRLKTALLMAFSFGVFQGVMPLIGYFLGETFVVLIAEYDHYVAFCLLFVIGAKMIKEGFDGDGAEKESELDLPVLLTLSIATSIDALAAGLSIAFLEMSVFLAAAMIGVASFVMSLLGFNIGKSVGRRFGSRMEVLGGLILIAIGVKIVLEHTGLL